jgi:hypothetical protein
MAQYLNHRLGCPYCLIVRLRVPEDVTPTTGITCSDCGEYLDMWEEMLKDFDKQGATRACSG